MRMLSVFGLLLLVQSTFCFTASPTRPSSTFRRSPARDPALAPVTRLSALDPISWAVINWGATEPRFSSLYNYQDDDGTYKCKRCDTPLYASSSKYNSGSGWPSFSDNVSGNIKRMERDYTGRFEIKCNNCDAHLGHVFPDGPKVKDGGTGWRHCVNGAALSFDAGAACESEPDDVIDEMNSDNNATDDEF